MSKNKAFPFKLAFGLIGLLIILMAGFLTVLNNAPQPASHGFQDFLGIGGDFTLTDQNGDLFNTSDIEEPFRLVYFGFTYCPAICPTELQKMSAALNELPDEVSSQIKPVFVSVDPERDTPEVLKSYLDLFPADFIGLTGSVEEIEAVKDQYKIYAAKVEMEGASEYTVDHSSYIYLMNAEMETMMLYKMNDTEEDLITSISQIVAE